MAFPHAAARRRAHSIALLLLVTFMLSASLLNSPASASLEYGFSDENNEICFVEEVAESETVNARGRIDHYIVGTYTWQPHIRNSRARFSMHLRSPDATVVASELLEANANGDPKAFAFKAEVDQPGPYMLCVSMAPGAGVLADDPIYISFDVDQSAGAKDHEGDDEEEEVAVALRQQYRRKRREEEEEQQHRGETHTTPLVTREVVDGMEVFVYRDFGGQVKSILQAPQYLGVLGRELNVLELEVRRKAGVLAEDLEKEGRMRQTSESTFNRVWVCAVMVIGITLLVVAWQFSLLKKTLKRKKKI